MYKVIDLFAGAGGLSLGFIQTGKFEVKVAYENSPEMQQTYKLNHEGAEVFGDVCTADYSAIRQKYGEIDVVIGGPPCQGFSNANRQRNHTINKNNYLVKQYIRAVAELRPKAFVMENVSMLKSNVHQFYMEESDLKLVEKYNLKPKSAQILLMDGRFVFDGIMDIIQDVSAAKSFLWPEDHYFEMNVLYKASRNSVKLKKALTKHRNQLVSIANKQLGRISANPIVNADLTAWKTVLDSIDADQDTDSFRTSIEPAIMYQKMLSAVCEISDNNLIVEGYDCHNGIRAKVNSFPVFDYLKAILGSDEYGYAINSRVLSAADFGAPQKRMRFVVEGIKKEITEENALPERKFSEDEYYTVHDAIADLEAVRPVQNTADDTGILLEKNSELSDLAKRLRDSSVLRNHIITATRDVALERFRHIKQGGNFHSLDEEFKTNTYTDVSRTQNTVYQRLDYKKPSGTVVNVRKSMWIHPVLDRAVSIREAARLQTFPDSFVFCGSKDKQYQQVGNAVPPVLAYSIAEKLASVLNENLDKGDAGYGRQSQQGPEKL